MLFFLRKQHRQDQTNTEKLVKISIYIYPIKLLLSKLIKNNYKTII